MSIEWLCLCINITDITIKYFEAILFEHPVQFHWNPSTPNWLQYEDSYELKYNGLENLDIY